MLPTTSDDEVWLTSTALETATPGLDDTPPVAPARRTITKYRRKLGIPSARARHPA
jgi:hypothetical protein